MKENEILAIRGTDYAEMTKRLLIEARLFEEIPSPECCIGIKPNLVCCSPAENGGTTHTQIIEGIILYLQSNGFKNIVVLEGSWVGDRTADAFEYLGCNALCNKYHVKIFDTQKDSSFTLNNRGYEINICSIMKDIDFLINVPVLKGHCQTKMTCALKNLKGIIPNKEKRRFHTLNLHTPIAYLNAYIKQDFIVVDDICGDPYFEEGGSPLVKNRIMAGKDPVLIDAFACQALNIDVKDVPYVGLAKKLGVGSDDLSCLKLTQIDGDPLKDILPNERLLDVSYAVEEVDSCSACYANLVPALCRLKEEGVLDSLTEKISIGQGFRGKSGPLGIGSCTKDFDFSVKGCPPKTEEIYRALKNFLKN